MRIGGFYGDSFYFAGRLYGGSLASSVRIENNRNMLKHIVKVKYKGIIIKLELR